MANTVHHHIHAVDAEHGAVVTLPHAEPPMWFSLKRRDAPKLRAWRDRMARIGHGTRTDIVADVALAEARAAEPAPPRPSLPQDGDPNPGERARVRPADNAKDWVEGEVLFIDGHEIALLRHDAEVGNVAVHFPRLGYDWRRSRL